MPADRHPFRVFFRYWLPVLLMFALIRVESTNAMSGANTGHILQTLLRLLRLAPSDAQIESANFILRKCGHFGGYGLLGLLTFRALRGSHLCSLHGYGWWRKAFHRVEVVHDAFADFWRWSWAGAAMGLVFLAASADEIHQHFLAGRTASPLDVLLDCSGAALFLTIVRLRTQRQLHID